MFLPVNYFYLSRLFNWPLFCAVQRSVVKKKFFDLGFGLEIDVGTHRQHMTQSMGKLCKAFLHFLSFSLLCKFRERE